MSHDPLCPIGQPCYALHSWDGCHILYEAYEGLIACDHCDRTCCCDVISKARADERRRLAADVRGLIKSPTLQTQKVLALIEEAP